MQVKIRKKSFWICTLFLSLPLTIMVYKSPLLVNSSCDESVSTAFLPSNRIHLVTYYHSITLTLQGRADSRLNDRVKEEKYALLKNLIHPLVANVHIIAENKEAMVDFLNNEGVYSDKIIIYNNSRPATMKDVFQYISQYKYQYNLVNKVSSFANGDIYLGNGFSKLNPQIMSKQRIMYTLTRQHSPEANCPESTSLCNTPYRGSHDTFVMRLTESVPIDVLKDLDYQLGTPGSTNRLMWTFNTKLNYCLLNPCSILQTYHFHCSHFYTNKWHVSTQRRSASSHPTKHLTCFCA